jgi:hypothetical protein
MSRLFVNSQLLRGIRESTDVVNMPEEKRALAIRAMRNAQHCIDICLRGENVGVTGSVVADGRMLTTQYRNGLRYGMSAGLEV